MLRTFGFGTLACRRVGIPSRKPYPTDASDEEWAFVDPYLSLIRQDAPQRRHGPRREVFNGLRWIVRTGSPWRYLPKTTCCCRPGRPSTSRDPAVDQEGPGVFEAMVHDLRSVLRLAQDRPPDPTAAVLDSRTLRSNPESGRRGGYDGAKRKKDSTVHAAVDGHPPRAPLGPARHARHGSGPQAVGNAGPEALQEATGASVELAYVDCGYSGERAAAEAEARGIRLEVAKHPASKKGFVLLPRRWVVERSFAGTSRFGRLAKDFERLPEAVAGLHFVAFACLFLSRAVAAIGLSPSTRSSRNGLRGFSGGSGRANVLEGLGGNDVLKVRDRHDNDTANGGLGSDTCQQASEDTVRRRP